MQPKLSVVAGVVIGVMAAQAAAAGSSSSIVGRWQTVRTCQGLVVDLQKVGLRAVAPAVVGDRRKPSRERRTSVRAPSLRFTRISSRATESSGRSTSTLSRSTPGHIR